MRIRELIVTHSNTDFDAFAGMVAAHKLYPEATIVLSGALNRNVREFATLHAEQIETAEAAAVEPRYVKRLILVETMHPNRLGELGPLCYQKGVEVVVFDHHRPEAEPPDFVHENNFITSEDGSLVTLMLRIIAERGIEVTPLEATVFALGIHEDTGSLGFSTATVRDAEALAFCMRQGASQTLIERYLHNPLTQQQRELLRHVLDTVESLSTAGLDVLIGAVTESEYVEGVSVVAHKVVDLTNCDAFFLLVEMEKRVFVTARSRGGLLDVAAVLKPLGGGGHVAAASGILKDQTLAQVKRRLRASLRAVAAQVRTAESVMSKPLHWVSTETTVDEALVTCQRYGYGGLSVIDDGLLVGSVARRDLDRAVSHRLGHAPVKAVMTSEAPYARASTPVEELAKLMARDPLGRVPIVRDDADEPVALDDVVGVVTRSDLLRELHRRAAPERVPTAVNVAERLRALGLDDFFALVAGRRGDVSRRLPGRRLRARPAPRGAQPRRRHRRRGRRHRVRARAGAAAQGARARAQQVPDRRRDRPGELRPRALPRRRRLDAHGVLRLPGRSAQGRAHHDPQRPGAARLRHQRHGRLAQARGLRRLARLLRRPRGPAAASASACCTT